MLVSTAQAQYRDSSFIKQSLNNNTQYFHWREIYFPIASVALGAYGNMDEDLINNIAIKNERNENMPHFRTHIDDYMQFAPLIAGYGFEMSGAKNNTWLYTKEILLNELILNASVMAVKHFSRVPSIVDGAYNAFPSGHTSQAFASATLFNDNFAQHKPWLQCLSYGSASTVGVLRILNGRHWTSDVIAGAGFGILSAKLSEWILVPSYNKKHSSNFNF